MVTANPYPILSNFTRTLPISELREEKLLTLEIQLLLKAGGFLQGQADGIFGAESTAAFHRFKIAANLEHLNLLGTTTAKALLEIAELGQRNAPTEANLPVAPASSGRSIKLPNNTTVFLGDRIFGSKHFIWAEATKNGTRNPKDVTVVANIVRLAEYLDRVREFFGDRPIAVTSWYRPRSVNRAVGGAENSTHLLGHAVDFKVQGVAPLEVSRRLQNWHGSAGGIGKSDVFTHLDLRGYYARWNYS